MTTRNTILKQKAAVRRRIEREAKQMLGVTSATAFKWIASGKLRGTIAEAELTGLRMLLKATQ